MQVWVDADACPGEIKELLFRAAKRRQVKVTLVANQNMYTPKSEFIDSILVSSGMNIADRRIVELTEPGDLVITADIPLAADVVAKGGQALNPARRVIHRQQCWRTTYRAEHARRTSWRRPNHRWADKLQRQRQTSLCQST